MTRSQAHYDAMLRHLGAIYYQTIHGDATPSDVARALESVEALSPRSHGSAHPHHHPPRSGRWRVRDVMISDVVTVERMTPYKEVARIMTEQRVNAVPVLDAKKHVIGMVSEVDLLRKEEREFRRLGTGLSMRSRHERAQAEARTAAQLMSEPPVTIHPDAPLGAAARLMNSHHVQRLPVVDPANKLLGIVSRRDLLSIYLRPDEELAAEIRALLAGILPDEPDGIGVRVQEGVAVLSGTLARPDLIPAAERLASGVDGVVSVINKLAGRGEHPVGLPQSQPAQGS